MTRANLHDFVEYAHQRCAGPMAMKTGDVVWFSVIDLAGVRHAGVGSVRWTDEDPDDPRVGLRRIQWDDGGPCASIPGAIYAPFGPRDATLYLRNAAVQVATTPAALAEREARALLGMAMHRIAMRYYQWRDWRYEVSRRAGA